MLVLRRNFGQKVCVVSRSGDRMEIGVYQNHYRRDPSHPPSDVNLAFDDPQLNFLISREELAGAAGPRSTFPPVSEAGWLRAAMKLALDHLASGRPGGADAARYALDHWLKVVDGDSHPLIGDLVVENDRLRRRVDDLTRGGAAAVNGRGRDGGSRGVDGGRISVRHSRRSRCRCQ